MFVSSKYINFTLLLLLLYFFFLFLFADEVLISDLNLDAVVLQGDARPSIDCCKATYFAPLEHINLSLRPTDAQINFFIALCHRYNIEVPPWVELLRHLPDDNGWIIRAHQRRMAKAGNVISYRDAMHFFVTNDMALIGPAPTSVTYGEYIKLPNNTFIRVDPSFAEGLRVLETTDNYLMVDDPGTKARMQIWKDEETRWRSFKYVPPKTLSERRQSSWYTWLMEDNGDLVGMLLFLLGCYIGYRMYKSENPTEFTPSWDSSELN